MNKQHTRRDFISKAIGGAAVLGINGPSGIEYSIDPQRPVSRRLKIVVAGGHPGDPEYGCGGTIARYSDLGHDVVLLYLNRGEAGISGKSASEAAKIRTAEAEAACRILKARPLFATQIDGESVVDAKRYKEMYDILESENPDIIFNQWPVDNHPDHRAIFTLIYDAWLKLGTDKTKKPELFYYEVSDGEDTMMFNPSYYVDITEAGLRKRDACFAHASQSPERFYSLQEQVAQFRGLECGQKQAEAFIQQIHARTDFIQ
jgi:N-acetylglucosamine malate deacetylase 1